MAKKAKVAAAKPAAKTPAKQSFKDRPNPNAGELVMYYKAGPKAIVRVSDAVAKWDWFKSQSCRIDQVRVVNGKPRRVVIYEADPAL